MMKMPFSLHAAGHIVPQHAIGNPVALYYI